MSKTIICLHGCNQTSETFKSYMKNLIRIFKPANIKFVFHSAKYPHSKGGMTWYPVELDVDQIGKIAYTAELVGDTLKDLNKVIAMEALNGKVILLGFSQGGNVVDAYLRYEYLKHYSYETGPISSAIIISGYSLVDPDINDVNIPLLNVVGEQDKIVPKELYPTRYKNYETYVHPDGHIIPKSECSRKILTWVSSTLP